MALEFAPGQLQSDRMVVHALWLTAALSCDGDSFAMTAATSPSLEDLAQGIVPGMPRLSLHHPLLAFDNGRDFLTAWFDAAEGRLDPFILIVEGSIPNENLTGDGYWAGFGADPETGQPIRTTEWIDRLAPRAAAVVAVGTCATYGGVPAMKNNPTGAMGLPDYLGWDFTSTEGVPIVCIPGCPAQPDNITETLLYVSMMLAGRAPMIELDEALRPKWLFGRTAHESCSRAAFYEQGDFAESFGSTKCMVKLGCKGPVARCNVGVRGWVRGRGGCPNVGGICIGCTMPGFPDKFMPFMSSAPPVRISTTVARFSYGPLLRMMRRHWVQKGSQAPAWRRPSEVVLSGYSPRWDVPEPGRRLEYSTYEVLGHQARCYQLGDGELARVEVHQELVFLGWTTDLEPVDWLELIHEPVVARGKALGLVILGEEEPDIRGDLTWRETRALVERPTAPVKLMRVDTGRLSLVWRRSPDHSGAPAEAGVSAPGFDGQRFRHLLLQSGTPQVKARADDFLRDARRARTWSREGTAGVG